MTRDIVLSLFFSCLVSAPALPQSEGHLRQHLEGKYVVLKIEMPATKEGVNLRLDRLPRIDRKEYAGKLSGYGTSIHRGEAVQVTLIKVKKKHIEFQLGGGGYGARHVRKVTYSPTPKTEREKKLEAELAALPEDDSEIRKIAQEKLEEMRQERESKDEPLRAQAAREQEAERQRVRERALASGSRFNLRYKKRVPANVLTPQGLMAVLSEYVDFSPQAAEEALKRQAVVGEEAPEPTANASGAHEPASPADAQAVADLRKGMLWDEVVTLLGQPSCAQERREGKLVVRTCTFPSKLGNVETEFVEGVLVRYMLTSW